MSGAADTNALHHVVEDRASLLQNADSSAPTSHHSQPYQTFHSPTASSSSTHSPPRSRTVSTNSAALNHSHHLSPYDDEGRLRNTTEYDASIIIKEERNCCGCKFACGRCLSHCWFLTACCGFVLLSSLPRFLALIDFVVTALIYSLSFDRSTSPSLSFWQFLQEDFEHYSFRTSGASLVLLSLIRTLTLFWLYAYRFHLKPFAFFWSTFIAVSSILFITIKWSLNENEHMLSLLAWSLSIVLVEYVTWNLLRRQRIRQPLLPILVQPPMSHPAHDAVDAHFSLGPTVADGHESLTVDPDDGVIRSEPKQVGSYQQLPDADTRPSAVGVFPSPSFRSPGSAALSASNSFASGASPSAGSSFGASFGSSFRMNFPQEQQIDAQSLADPDSLFMEIDSLSVHYKLSINGKNVMSDEQQRLRDIRLAGSSDAGHELKTASEFTSPTSAAAAAAAAASNGASSTSSFSPTVHTPIILLHGFGSSLFQWKAMWAELTAHAPLVLAFDRPGFGLTSRPLKDSTGSYGSYVEQHNGRGILVEQENPYTQQYSVVLLQKLMHKLGIDQHKSLIVGHSTGGAIAIRTALTSPSLFSGLFLISPHIFTAGFPSMIKSLLKTKLGNMIVQQLVRSELGEVTMKRAWADPSHIPPESVITYQRILKIKHQMEGLIEIAAVAVPKSDDPFAELPKRLKELAGKPSDSDSSAPGEGGIPICIVHGAQDRLLDISESMEAFRLLQQDGVHATLVKIDGCGHVPMEEFPVITLQHLFAFIHDAIESHQQLTHDS